MGASNFLTKKLRAIYPRNLKKKKKTAPWDATNNASTMPRTTTVATAGSRPDISEPMVNPPEVQ